jgi:hypothetical protein
MPQRSLEFSSREAGDHQRRIRAVVGPMKPAKAFLSGYKHVLSTEALESQGQVI